MFALRDVPPRTLRLAGARYRLVRVFKHDFLAATCLYEAEPTSASPVEPLGDAPGARVEFPRIVAKFGRSQSFLGLPMDWAGRLLRGREEEIYRALAGVEGVPRWVGRIDSASYAIEFVDGAPLDHVAAPPPGFFDRLRALFGAIHDCGVAYCDANKRSNILVGPRGKPFLVDYQIAIRRRDDLPWPLRSLVAGAVRYCAKRDLYHLCKHKRRLCPHELTVQEEALSRYRVGLHWLHRKLTKPWRSLRRRFLQREYQAGQLTSPTADLEDHPQPEKDVWRAPPAARPRGPQRAKGAQP